MTMAGRSQWYFDLEHLYKTPSAEDGKLIQDELMERNKGVDFMFRVGITLGLYVFARCPVPRAARRLTHDLSLCVRSSLTPLYTAATYLHRFYMRHSLEDYNYHVRLVSPRLYDRTLPA